MDNGYKIISKNGHYEAYNNNGGFILSGDSWRECYNDLMEMFQESI